MWTRHGVETFEVMGTAGERVERRLAAILAADVAGYARLMAADEVATFRTLSAHRQIFDALVANHGGRIANTAGDSVLADFPSAVHAVECAMEAQEHLAEANAHLTPDQRLEFRIGVNVGDVVVQGGDLLGDGVNIAARLQTLAEPGGICVSGTVTTMSARCCRSASSISARQFVKNIDGP